MVKRPRLIWLRLSCLADRSGTAMTALSVLPTKPDPDRPDLPQRG
jgi:hypothetical protein